MKKLLILAFIISASNLFGQTDSIEKKILYNRYTSGQITLENFSETGIKWNKMISKIGRYTELPFAENGKVEYTFNETFPSQDKSGLYNRTLEWLAINYGIIPTYIYTNPADGKIISTQSFNTSGNEKCTYCYVFTIRDRKLKLEVINIDFETRGGGYYVDGSWIPESTNTIGLEQMFPIILKRPAEWEKTIRGLGAIDAHFREDIEKLKAYILSYNERYSF